MAGEQFFQNGHDISLFQLCLADTQEQRPTRAKYEQAQQLSLSFDKI